MYKYIRTLLVKVCLKVIRGQSLKGLKNSDRQTRLDYFYDDRFLVYAWFILGQNIYMKIDRNSYIDKQVLYNKSYSENINFHILRNIIGDTIFIDVGSNIGTTALPAALLKPNVIVEAFEPNPKIFQQLMDNKRINRALNVNLHNLAVGAERSVLRLNIPRGQYTNFGTASLLENSDIHNPIQEEVSVVDLDTVFVERSRPISVLKIDVQGFEWNVLQGAANLIAEDKPVIVFEHEDRYAKNPSEIKQNLQEFFLTNGYTVFEIDRYDYRRLRYVKWGSALNCNLIALHTEN